MRVIWKDSAIDDLSDIRDRIGKHNPEAAAKVATRLVTVTDLLVDNPKMGREGRVGGTRELVVSGTRYFLVYEIVGEAIEIFGVIDSRQDWP